MSMRSSRMVESLTRQPLAKTIASRKSAGKSNSLMPVPEGDNSPVLKGVSQYTLSPSRSAKSFPVDAESGVLRDDNSEPDQLMMTDNAMDLRARMEAELIALRRAQSIFAESHPSVDVHGKLQDLQEMYIGDLLVKDCQISQMKEQLESVMQERSSARSSNISTPTTTASVPSPHASMLAARVQCLQRSVSSERQRRQEVEARLEDVLRYQEATIDAKSEINRLVTAHRTETHQLKARLTQMQEANKRLQEKVFSRAIPPAQFTPNSGEQSPSTPASSAVGGGTATDKVAYVKYASLRAEKRQMEAKLAAQLEQLKLEKEQAISEREGEMEKLKEHHRRVVADLERKTRMAQQSKTEEGKELRDLRHLYEGVLSEKNRFEKSNLELKGKIEQLNDDLIRRDSELAELIESEKFLSLELEDREKRISQIQSSEANVAEIEKLKEERLDLLERVEEREDYLKALQDEAGVNAAKISQLQAKLESKEREIASMISQADELDNLLARADQDVTSSRVKIQALTAELDSLRAVGGKAESIVKAMTVNADQMRKQFEAEKEGLTSRLNAVIDERDRLTSLVEKREGRSLDAETKISELETELENIRNAMHQKRPSGDEDNNFDVVSSVEKAEGLFHEAVELCSESEFEHAVSLLQNAAQVLANLSKTEIAGTQDQESLRILESDIYGQLGVAFQSLSQVAEAVQSYTTAVDIDPEAHACHANLAVLLHHQSRGKEAEGHAALASQLAPDIEEYQQLLSQIKSSYSSSAAAAANVTLSSPSSLRHSTRW